jgi:CyaY protein
MERSEFNRRSSEVFQRLEVAIDQLDPDEAELDVHGGVIYVSFADGARFVVNTQAAAHQIWLAGGAQGWHFGWNAEQEKWIGLRKGDELYATFQKIVGEKLGYAIHV